MGPREERKKNRNMKDRVQVVQSMELQLCSNVERNAPIRYGGDDMKREWLRACEHVLCCGINTAFMEFAQKLLYACSTNECIRIA